MRNSRAKYKSIGTVSAILAAILFVSIITAASALFMLYNGMEIFGHLKDIESDIGMEKSEVMKNLNSLRNPDSEIRGIWIATVMNIDFPSEAGLNSVKQREEIDEIISTVKSVGINAVFFQVRPTCDALYNSGIFPVSDYLNGNQNKGLTDGFDPLAYMIEAAHKEDIDVHAWINPLRVTAGGKTIDDLGENNPARQNPDWVIEYADGKLYFDCGRPEVRELIARGCEEIVQNYDIDGIVFDDYFYPYPVNGAVFNDSETFDLYGGEMSLGDWRRNNVNDMIKGCYDAVKSNKPTCKFGISPFGIWQNNDGNNGGSDTSGFNAYASLYADALAWIKGGYVDYISPQLYWQFSQSNAKYDILCRWWNAQCSGTGVELIISHGAYRSEEWGYDNEMVEQVEYARSEQNYKGSIFYGYGAIKRNEQNLQGQLKKLYSEEIIYTTIQPEGCGVNISVPSDNTYVDASDVYILGKCDPGYALYIDGKPVSVTKSGAFTVVKNLKPGENRFIFTQDGNDTELTVIKGKAPANDNSLDLGEYKITDISPVYDYSGEGGVKIKLSCYAPNNSTVTAEIGGTTINLRRQNNPKGNSKYIAAYYEAEYTLPAAEDNTLQELGRIKYTAVRDSEYYTVEGACVNITSLTDICGIEVIKPNAYLKVSPDSLYYDDYTPAALGMRDCAVGITRGFYKLRMNGYISVDSVKITEDVIAESAPIESAELICGADTTDLYVKLNEHVPVNGYINDKDEFSLTLYNVSAGDDFNPSVSDNPLFTDLYVTEGPIRNSIRMNLKLIDRENFYGFEYYYTDDGYIVVSFRNPQKLNESERPLEGKKIVLDAGHGGYETGALTPVAGYTEKDLNLKFVLAANEKLTALGADVILMRSDDTTVVADERTAYLDELCPDMCISMHLNSMSQGTDITSIRGLMGLYFSDSGLLLAGSVSHSTARSLGIYERRTASQELKLVRNPRFPSTLIELGFLTCAEEFDYLNSARGIEAVAQGIADGVLEYYSAQSKYVITD